MRLIFEFVQLEPIDYPVGFCSGRVWINGVSSSRVFFCDTPSNYYLFADTSNAAIELCSRKVTGSPDTRDSTRDSNSDIVNFMWFKGFEGLFNDALGN